MTLVKGIVVAGLSGGSGKSVVSVGLTAAWTQTGQRVAPFKKGPDYIDAGWLHRAAGTPCYNLDPYLVPEEQIRASFYQRIGGSDRAIVEGNRGLYDGVTAHGGYSTAELAITLDLPVLLVVNCTKTTRTIAALVLGCRKFDERVNIIGVVLNQVATERQRALITEAVEHYTDVEVLGAIPRLKRDVFPMRHLGMIPHQEYEDSHAAINLLGRIIEENTDLERIESRMAQRAPETGKTGTDLIWKPTERDVRIGILQDTAFQFYYPENLAALEREGAELIRIDALKDPQLPELDGLYIGGGFPETSAPLLAANKRFRESVKGAADSGMPIYAECGGLIYLGSSITLDDHEYPLVGVFPVRFGMSRKPQAHGYSIFTAQGKNVYYQPGETVKGHEFRYSTVLQYAGDTSDLVLQMERGTGFLDGRDGLVFKNVLATYTHIHAEGTPGWAVSLVEACRVFAQVRATGPSVL